MARFLPPFRPLAAECLPRACLVLEGCAAALLSGVQAARQKGCFTRPRRRPSGRLRSRVLRGECGSLEQSPCNECLSPNWVREVISWTQTEQAQHAGGPHPCSFAKESPFSGDGKKLRLGLPVPLGLEFCGGGTGRAPFPPRSPGQARNPQVERFIPPYRGSPESPTVAESSAHRRSDCPA